MHLVDGLQRSPHCRAASSIGSKASAAAAALTSRPVPRTGSGRSGCLRSSRAAALDDPVALERPRDVPDVAQPLLLRRGLEREVPVAQQLAHRGLVHGDVEDPGQRGAGVLRPKNTPLTRKTRKFVITKTSMKMRSAFSPAYATGASPSRSSTQAPAARSAEA